MVRLGRFLHDLQLHRDQPIGVENSKAFAIRALTNQAESRQPLLPSHVLCLDLLLRRNPAD